MGGIWSGRCASGVRLDGKTAIITGCNTGIGKFTAMDLYKRGCKIIMACRNTNKAETARQEILKEVGDSSNVGELVVEELDLSSLNSVRRFSEKILKKEPQINLLINNAGVMMCPKSFTADGFETHFGTNHLGHFLLTMLLLPRIIKSAPARIVVVSSVAHAVAYKFSFDNLNAEKSYDPFEHYANSKLANVLFANELSRRLKGLNVNVYSLHPGIIQTELTRHMDDSVSWGVSWLLKSFFKIFMISIDQGSQTTIYCAVDEKTAGETGLYYSKCKAVNASRQAMDPDSAKKLWDLSLEMVKLPKDFDPFNAA